MKNIDSKNHVTGKSVYLDDIPVQTGTLYGAVFGSPKAHGKIINLDYSHALALDGVEYIFTHKDIPGKNQIGGILEDEPLFAEDEVHFMGQPVAFVVAQSEKIAQQAAREIQLELEEREVITDPREARQKGQLLFPPRTFKMGDIDQKWQECDYIFEGKADSGGQEHLYIETQGSYAYPMDQGSIKIHSSTQGATLVQKIAARILGTKMHLIEVDVARLGGAFGGKEDQATAYACMAALAANHLQKPVKIVLHRLDDMKMTGKRHPYSSDFKIGLSKDYKILAFQATMYQNGGAASDLSPAILERTLFHSTNTYYIPNTEVTVYSCKTNLPPNTAFRGFGGPQGMFLIESAIAKAACELNISKRIIQEKNFLQENDLFQYGQVAKNVNIAKCFQTADKKYHIQEIEQRIAGFNTKNTYKKKGMAVMPICFGISFTKTPMNQARALVHIYQDGSVGISTGAVEMGQGVNTKMIQVAAKIFSIHPKRIKIESTNTTRVANTSPTAASSGADLNGNALRIACNGLMERLKQTAAGMLSCNVEDISIEDEIVYQHGKKTTIFWELLIETAFLNRVSLTENGHYATPVIYFDKSKEKGHPFAYHVYGTAIITVTVDCLRGTYAFDDVKIVHDFGNSMNTVIDNGQVEGAVVQGIGWMTIEELAYAKNGSLLSNSLSTYKIPDIYSVPKTIEITPLKTEGPELAILRSKAIGEPPLMYGIGAYFAIAEAIKAFNPKYKIDFDAPFTPEKVLMRLYHK
ncbi:MAG: molybdopterin cofactor-binding domain-containing protein [Bacteroidales bacterium]|jgi:xanthine dehydrogenase large subunit|nr:molybdopterin cofactor-binding domain-containing protein [Bacteroidales bacterium]